MHGLGQTMARILIVDDKSSSRELERIVLESFGHEVFEASNGREAIEVAMEGVPDIVLLDLHMPELDGYATLLEFRKDERFSRTPVVALTASAMQGDEVRALEAGFSGYITKPVSLHDLHKHIRGFLKTREAQG